MLLGNHDHFFLETPEPNLSGGSHLLNGSYTGCFNVQHKRVGHLFQGRFKAHLIQEAGKDVAATLAKLQEQLTNG